MGRRVFWADKGSSNYAGSNDDYAVAHALANGDWLGASSHMLVGQAVGWIGSKKGILRAKVQFPTLNIPLTETVLSASIFAVFNKIAAAPQVELNIVSGVGLSADVIDTSDYGTLLPQIIPYSSIIIPAGGFPDMLHRELVLSAGGIGEILEDDWTQFGYRGTQDILTVTPVSQHDYCSIVHGFYDGFLGLVHCNPATTNGHTINFSGILLENSVTYGLFQKLVIQTDGLIDGSQFDVRFAYGTTPPPGMGPWVPDAYTPWILAQPLDQTFSAVVNGLPFGHYYYAVETRTPDVEMGTNTWLSGLFQLTLQPNRGFGNLPNKLISEGLI